jgi:UDP-N-acetylmuramoyl-L-alanyl-D-glutamate--2,6-diaminopimelate ligase
MLNYLKNFYHLVFAWLSAVIFGFPSRKLYVLGVTGTKGKSTVIALIAAILEAAGKRVASLSSVEVRIGEATEKNKTSMTMPGRGFIQKLLARAARAGCDYALLEVTSQGVVQSRHRFIDFDAALITNLHPEHIESHGSFEAYRDAKCRFFTDAAKSRKPNKLFFINAAMAERPCFEDAAKNNEIIFFEREDFINNDLKNHYNLESSEAKKMLSSWLQNDFNLENVAAAAAFARTQNISDSVIFKALQDFHGVIGRMEYVRREPFAVVVDYAHTPESLEAVYKAVSEPPTASQSKKLICVLGAAGGGRDRWKRPKMGAVAAKHCKEIILTNEDPFDEPPAQILEDIEKGIFGAAREVQYEKILDRREAIAKAMAIAEPGDAVVLTGKGSEQYIRVAGGKKIPWNERAVVEEILGQNQK